MTQQRTARNFKNYWNHLSRRGQIILAVALIVFVSLIALSIMIMYSALPAESDVPQDWKNQIAKDVDQSVSDLTLGPVLAAKDGWSLVSVAFTDDGEGTEFAIFKTDNHGKTTLWGHSAEFDLPTMTEAGVPAEIQAVVLNISLEDAKQQIQQYQAMGPYIDFTGFEELRAQGIDQHDIEQIQNLLSSYSQTRHANDPNIPLIKAITLTEVRMDGAGTGDFIYHCTLLIDETAHQLDIHIGINLGQIILTDENGDNPVVLNPSGN